jgi:tetratricopeptide (TPR) repeat protein
MLIETQRDDQSGFRFTHDLIHEAILADLSAPRESAWHLLYAEALEALVEEAHEWRAADLERHFLLSDEPWRALPYALLAGDQAQVVYAHTEAEEHYRAALALARKRTDQAREAEALEKLHHAVANQARYDEAIILADQANSLYRALGDEVGALRMLARFGEMHITLARPSPALERLASVRPQVEGSPPSHALERYYASLARLYSQSGRSEDALVMAERATTLARSLEDATVLIDALFAHASILLDVRHTEEYLRALEELIPLAETTGDWFHLSFALAKQAMVATAQGNFVFAEERIQRAVEVAERLGEPTYVATATFFRGLLAFQLGQWNRAGADLTCALDLYRLVGPTATTAPTLLILARLRMAQGRRDEARAHVEELISSTSGLVPAFRDQLLRGAHAILAENELLQGRPDAALALFEQVRDASDEALEIDVPIFAWIHIEVGEYTQAETMLATYVTRAAAEGELLFIEDGHRTQAILSLRKGSLKDTEQILEKTLARCRAFSYPYGEAKSLWVCGLMYEAQGRLEAARESYSAALTILNQLGERLYAELIERTLATLPVVG